MTNSYANRRDAREEMSNFYWWCNYRRSSISTSRTLQWARLRRRSRARLGKFSWQWGHLFAWSRWAISLWPCYHYGLAVLMSRSSLELVFPLIPNRSLIPCPSPAHLTNRKFPNHRGLDDREPPLEIGDSPHVLSHETVGCRTTPLISGLSRDTTPKKCVRARNSIAFESDDISAREEESFPFFFFSQNSSFSPPLFPPAYSDKWNGKKE